MLGNEKEMGQMLPPYWRGKITCAMNLLSVDVVFAEIDQCTGEKLNDGIVMRN